MSPISQRLDIWNAMLSRGEVPSTTGRELLTLFGAKRRGWRVVAWIRDELFARSLVTEPDFDEVWVDVPLLVKRAQSTTAVSSPSGSTQGAGPVTVGPGATGSAPVAQTLPKQKATDPIRRISLLRAANKTVVSVPPNTSLKAATTIMMLNDFSQLPVIQNERDCKGAVTWQSIATATAMGKECRTVNDCMVPCEEVASNASLLEAIQKVAAKEFALVRGLDRRFQGIVTVVDLSLQFRALSEPFLLLEQIENLLRSLIRECFTVEEMRKAKHEADTSRKVDDVSDLTFGEYVNLLEHREAWPKLKVSFERDSFIAKMKEVRDLRNDIMHFDPDPLEDDDITLLRNFAGFLERVAR
ncbi:CBS domain-containing protein [Corallococcus caeni]|uniref:CBS domain-containing protein n=1 Tax=Corallococcus caeni TaxID=3082388 RepID=UPI00295606FC|nr:CBS domain-containing protein [Corallococcus sp. KH5-1]